MGKFAIIRDMYADKNLSAFFGIFRVDGSPDPSCLGESPDLLKLVMHSGRTALEGRRVGKSVRTKAQL